MIHEALEPVYFLVVDDVEENLFSLEALMRREGLVVLKANSGPEALELLLKYEVALAFLDVQMPGMDGFELAELMRGTERTRRVPIIFLTAGAANTQRRFRGYEAGAVDFLYKPVEPTILKSKSDVFFDLHRQQQLLARQRNELRAYADALQQADKRKDEFIATLAHELRNPLAPIRNGLQILRMSPNSEMAATVRDMMDRQLSHLVRLIDDLLDVSRVSQGKVVLRREAITLQSAIQSALETSLPLIEAAQHQLALDIPEKPIWVGADFTRLAQILSNLLNNAAKYTPNKGLIRLGVRLDNESVVVSITDNGLGIPPDMLVRIFEMFTQVEQNMNKSQGGLGIGLALVHMLVAMHDGKIEAASEGVGKGSTFSLTLPVIAPPAAVEKKHAAQAGPEKTHRILVVDDNVGSAKTIGWMLEMKGHRVKQAFDGRTALAVAKDFEPDIILLDIGLPEMSGYDVCRTLKRDPHFKKTLFIAQTGWGQEADRKQAFDAGFDHHIIKPIDFKKLNEYLQDGKLTAG